MRNKQEVRRDWEQWTALQGKRNDDNLSLHGRNHLRLASKARTRIEINRVSFYLSSASIAFLSTSFSLSDNLGRMSVMPWASLMWHPPQWQFPPQKADIVRNKVYIVQLRLAPFSWATSRIVCPSWASTSTSSVVYSSTKDLIWKWTRGWFGKTCGCTSKVTSSEHAGHFGGDCNTSAGKREHVEKIVSGLVKQTGKLIQI